MQYLVYVAHDTVDFDSKLITNMVDSMLSWLLIDDDSAVNINFAEWELWRPTTFGYGTGCTYRRISGRFIAP